MCIYDVLDYGDSMHVDFQLKSKKLEEVATIYIPIVGVNVHLYSYSYM